MTAREGSVLVLNDQSGRRGLGECAPLLGYSSESLSEAERQLVTVSRRILHSEIEDVQPLESAAAICDGSLPSSVRFAVESALLSLAALLADSPVAAILSPDYALSVPVNALVESSDNLRSRLGELAAHNCRAVKLKVGRHALAEDIETVKRVRESLSPEIALRLDANRAWTLDQATRFAEGIRGCAIEYIEEPLRDSNELALMHNVAPELPLAIDESVRDMSIDNIREAEHLRAVVVKPTVVGGIARTFEIVRACRQSGKTPVLGAAIESSLGLGMIAIMAASLISDTPIGLDTARLFSRDLISPPLDLVDYAIDIDQPGFRICTLNADVIEEVPLG